MSIPKSRSAVIVAAAALMAGVSTVAMAQSQDAAHTIANNGSLFIDGRKFTIASGSSERDISAQIETLGAKQLGSSAIIFRSGDKLYIASAPVRRGLVARRRLPDRG